MSCNHQTFLRIRPLKRIFDEQFGMMIFSRRMPKRTKPINASVFAVRKFIFFIVNLLCALQYNIKNCLGKSKVRLDLLRV